MRTNPALAIALLAFGSSNALAQGAPPESAPAATPSPEIVVTGERPASRSSIDRKVYSVSHDLQAASGSAADILRNLPSVDVDAQGNVSLRGDSNVQILIDGKPSTSMSAANRGEVLQQLPADSIQSIEVMTNPSAQFKPDGSSGLINIVTRRSRKPGRSGTAQASVGSDGRFNLGVTGAYNAGPLSLNGSLTFRRDVPHRTFVDQRSRTDPNTGITTSSVQDSLFASKRLSRIATLGVDYDLSAADRLSASGTYNVRTGAPRITEHDLVTDGNGATIAAYDRSGLGYERETNSEAWAKYRHTFAGKGHEFSLDIRRGESAETQQRRHTNTYAAPAGLVTIDEQRPHADEVEREITADYSRPMGGGAKLEVGYDLQRNDDSYDNSGGTADPSSGAFVADPSLTNRFIYGQTIHALYGTYERPFGSKLRAILGLRLEDAIVDTNQVTGGMRDHNSYFRAYPTLHLQYDLSESQNVRLSYSHRVARPEAEDLNPFPVFQDPLNLRAGNPHLLPQETHSFEAGYEFNGRGTSWQATFYLRKSYNGFTEVSRFISPNVLLTTKENLGRSTSGGLEVAGNGKFSRVLSYNLSGNIFYNQINASNLGIPGNRSTFSFAAKGSLDYHLSSRDLLQVSVIYSGKRLTAQGYRLPSGTINLGYRRQLRPDLAAVLSVSDLLDSQRDRTLIDTPFLHDIALRRRARRTVSLALNWQFGGTKKAAREPQFDYSADSGSGASK